MVEEYFYNGSLEKIKSITESLNAERVFIVHGKNSFSLSGAEDKIKNSCWDIRFDSFTDFSPNPTFEEVLKGIDSFKKENYDLVMAVGGGSAIDVAKLINIFSFQKFTPERYILKEKEMEIRGKPFLAAPTTAGTGSEATHFAVIYMDNKKYSVAHQYILPDYVILDPELTLTLPKYQTACTGMDALCQGIESYWSVNSSEESKKYARTAIELTLDNIVKAVEEPDDLEVRKNMMEGANYSGKAINISKTTAPHACSYVISSKCGIPHGHAVAIMMKEFIRYNGENYDRVVDERGEEYVRSVMDELHTMLGCRGPKEASEFFAGKIEEVELENSLRKVCKELDVEEFVEGVNLERLENNPLSLNRQELNNIFSRWLQINEDDQAIFEDETHEYGDKR